MKKEYRRFAPLGLIVGVLAALTAAGWYFVVRDFVLGVQISLGLAVIGVAAFIILDPDQVRMALTGRQARYGSNALILVLAFTGILVVVNYWVYQNPQRWDISEDQTNSLAPETLAVLEQVEAPVHVTGFYSTRAAMAEDQARELLDNYVFYSDGLISYEFIDPEASPIAAQAAGITQDRSLVLTSGDAQETITFASESELTGALVRLVSGAERVVYFLSGHGEYALDGTGDYSYSVAFRTLVSKNYRVEPLNLLALNAVPEDADLIVIAGPTVPVTADEVALLAEYMAGGGALVVLTEPPLMTDYGDAPDPLADYLAESWGIVLGNDLVVDIQSESSLEAVADAYADHAITQKMEGVATLFPTAHSVRPEIEVAGVFKQPLILTAPFDTTWAETDLESLVAGLGVEPSETEDVPGPVPVAVVAENIETGARLVVFGDSEFVVDLVFFVQRNGDMFINSVDWATEQEELINLTPNIGTQRFLMPPFPMYTNLVALFAVCLVPGAVFGAGVVVWVLRRRRM